MPEATNIIRFDEKRALFEKGLSRVYKDTLKTTPQTYLTWLRERTAEAYIETDMAVSGLGVAGVKPVGGAPQTDRIYYGPQKSYTMQFYGHALVIQYEAIRWDLYGVFPEISRDLAKTSKTRYDIVAWGCFNNSFVTTDPDYVDQYGEALVATGKTRFDLGTWSNRPASATGLSMLAIETATTGLRTQVNHRGIFTGDLTPRKLVVGEEQRWLANTLLKSATNPENANQQYNNAANEGLSPMTTPYITSATAWWLLCDKESYKIWMSKGDDPDLVKDNEANTRNRVFTSYFSFCMNVREAMGWFGDAGV